MNGMATWRCFGCGEEGSGWMSARHPVTCRGWTRRLADWVAARLRSVAERLESRVERVR